MHKLLSKVGTNEKLLLAVSGGGDSLAMLVWFAMQKEWRERIFCAHVDHMLMEDSIRVSEHVREIAAKLNVPFAARRVNVPQHLSVRNESIEACARRLRYAALDELRAEFECAFVVTAHTMEDDAETVWMRLAMDSSWFETTGIPQARDLILRPFLFVRRDQMRGVLESKFEPREDPMNLDSRFPRVRARAALSLTETGGKNVVNRLAGHGQAVRKLLTLTGRLLSANKNNSLKDEFRPVRSLESLSKNLYLEDLEFLKVEKAAQRVLGGNDFRLSAPVRRQVLEFLKSDSAQSVLFLCEGLFLHRTDRHLWIQRECQNDDEQKRDSPEMVWTPSSVGDQSHGVIELNCSNVSVRCWHPGETFRPAKRRTKKISDWLADAGVHPAVRTQWPVVTDGESIIAVPGLGVREEKMARADEPVFRIRWKAISHSDQQVSR